MKRYILGILFFSGIWGLSEALLGGYLYGAKVHYASVPLTIIAFAILTVAGFYFPKPGTATLMALCAMLYKFFNSPFFACHLLGIAMLGICYDVFFACFRMKSKMLSSFAAVLLNYVLFAFMMTYITNNGFWNTSKLSGHILEGLIAAVGCACFAPAIFRLGQLLKSRSEQPPETIRWKPAEIFVSMIAMCVWGFGITTYVMQFYRTANF